MSMIPFSEEELEVVGAYGGDSATSIVKLNTPITAKENYLAFLRNETPCWMPDGDMITINPEIIPDNVARAFVIEADPTDKKGGPDMFGIEWVYEELADGSMVVPGNPVLADANDWPEVIKFPDVDSWDWKGSAARNKDFLGTGDDPVWTVQFTGLFERLISFMDFSNAALALIDEDQKDAVKALFDALCDNYIRIFDHALESYGITGYLFHDDWGGQAAPFFSKDTYNEMIAPYIRKMVNHCHEKGVIFELHSCGHTDSIADAIAATGIDMWRPQPMNDIDMMYREYGDKFKLGVRGPMFAPDVTEEEQIKAAQDIVARFNEPGKYVFTSNRAEPPMFRKALYEASRKAYCALEPHASSC